MINDDTPPAGIRVSSDAFVVIVDRLARIETTLEEIRRDRADHESRIRAIEKWRYSIPATFITSVVSAAVAIYGQLGR